MSGFELVALKSGLKSLRALENRETFHPVTGPSLEANILHVRQQRLVERSAMHAPLVIWDVGLGAAANVIAAIEALQSCRSPVEIHSFDKTRGPIEFALRHAEELGYLKNHQGTIQELLLKKTIRLGACIQWRLHEGDFWETLKDEKIPSPHAIFYDPYSPRGNPEMWSLEHFTALRRRLSPDVPCLLTNYSRSTSVRVTLLLAGFFVGHGVEIGQKSETTVASNCLELLEKPISRPWLERVRASGNAAPLCSGTYSMEPIRDQDFLRLSQLPQFL